jgi:hypothetical protein
MDQQLSPQWVAARDSILESLKTLAINGKTDKPRPDRLFHFTDAAGLIGIVRNQTVWASHAPALNDFSEIKHGIELASDVLLGPKRVADPEFAKMVAIYLDRKNAGELAVQLDVYVVALCARADHVLHWLHYGRSGTGVALELNAAKLEQPPFDLFPVIYDLSMQRGLIEMAVGYAWQDVKALRPTVPPDDQEPLVDVAARMAADFIWLLAARFKNPCFEGEDEWRLITFDMSGKHVPEGLGTPLEPQFRAVGGRVVPYLEVTYAELPVTRIVLGASCPMAPDEEPLGLFLRAVKRPVPIVRSLVPVRQ